MKEEKNKSLGFTKDVESKDIDDKKITPKLLEKQGLIPELVGRLPIIVKLEKLTKDDLKSILTDTENSIVSQYSDLISLDNVKMTVSDKALDFIADKAFTNNTGARGLKSIIEGLMLDTMFEIPSTTDLSSIKLDVKNNELYIKKYHNRNKKLEEN